MVMMSNKVGVKGDGVESAGQQQVGAAKTLPLPCAILGQLPRHRDSSHPLQQYPDRTLEWSPKSRAQCDPGGCQEALLANPPIYLQSIL